MKSLDTTLIPAVVQHHLTGEVLMVAYMNDDAIRLTRETGLVHFWSRSRGALWQKGETSGNSLSLVELRLDCDNDTLLVRAAPAGPTCHTGNRTCFFSDGDEGPAASAIEALYRTIAARKAEATDEANGGKPSYTRSLLDAGVGKVIGKIVEECGEFCAELPDGPDEKVIYECADLFYHVLVGLGGRNISPEHVMTELGRRMGMTGFEAKAKQAPAKSPRPGKSDRSVRAAKSEKSGAAGTTKNPRSLNAAPGRGKARPTGKKPARARGKPPATARSRAR